jgi:aminoglycoside phosphotransferase (APT) family kinase protein
MGLASAAAVCAALGLGRPCEPAPRFVARGAMGEVWEVRTERGRWALKALFAWVDAPPLPGDVEVQLAARAAGLALPRPVVHEGVAVVEVDGRRHRAYEWVDVLPELRPPVDEGVAADVGRILATVHQLPVPPEGAVDDWYTTAPSVDELGALADAAARRGAGWASALRAALPAVEGLLPCVSADHGPIVLAHGDLTPANVLPVAGGGLVTLDWENVGPLPADEELAATVIAWCASEGRVATGPAAALLDGYRSAGGRAALDPARSCSMIVCTTLNYLRVVAEQALDDPEHRSFAEDRLAHLLGPAGGVAGLLGAVRSLP